MKRRSIPLVICMVLTCIVLPVSGGITALSAHAAADVLAVVNDSVPEVSLSPMPFRRYSWEERPGGATGRRSCRPR